MNDEIPRRSLEDLVEEGENLLKARPFCHEMKNDLTAALLLCKLHRQGFDVSIEEAQECIHRMRVAVETGVYPDELLQQAEADSHV